MKKWIILFCLLFAGHAFAGPATFQWDANTEQDLAGYKVHYGSQPGQYTTTIDCGLPPTEEDGKVYFAVSDLPDVLTYYAGTAYDTAGNESGYSNEVSNNDPPSSPQNFGGTFAYKMEGIIEITPQ